MEVDATTQATLRWLQKLALSQEAREQLNGIRRPGITLPILRAMGHEGLKDLGFASALDRAIILATEGDAPRPKVDDHVSDHEKKKRRTCTFEVVRAEIVQVKEIDPIEQKFGATVLFEFVVRNGAKDPDFWPDDGKDESDAFRFPCPPARWFWHNQVYLTNALSFELLEKPKVVRKPDSDDLTCMFFATGEFQERFELESFPFDAQTLTMILEIKCAINGPVPAEILIPKEVIRKVDVSNFHKNNVWYLSNNVKVDPHWTGVEPKLYPALKCSFTVGRRSAFYLWQLFVPVSLFSFMTIFVHFFLPVDSTELPDRLALTITFVLTSAAYKFVTVSLIPAVGYLTFADKYMTAALFLQCATVIQNCFLGLPALQPVQPANATNLNSGDLPTALETYNTVSLWVLMGLWALIHLVSAGVARWKIHQRTKALGDVYRYKRSDSMVRTTAVTSSSTTSAAGGMGERLACMADAQGARFCGLLLLSGCRPQY